MTVILRQSVFACSAPVPAGAFHELIRLPVLRTQFEPVTSMLHSFRQLRLSQPMASRNPDLHPRLTVCTLLDRVSTWSAGARPQGDQHALEPGAAGGGLLRRASRS